MLEHTKWPSTCMQNIDKYYIKLYDVSLMDPFGRPSIDRPGMRLHCKGDNFPPLTEASLLEADASETLVRAIVGSHITGTPDRFSDAVKNAGSAERSILGAPEEGITDRLYIAARGCAAKIVKGECPLFKVVENSDTSGPPFEIVRNMDVGTIAIETNTAAPEQRIPLPPTPQQPTEE